MAIKWMGMDAVPPARWKCRPPFVAMAYAKRGGCDDGNQDDEDGCDSNCQVEGMPGTCGNSIQEPGETCDDGNDQTERCAYGERACEVCNAQCQRVAGETSYCGDGDVDAVLESSVMTATRTTMMGAPTCVVCPPLR